MCFDVSFSSGLETIYDYLPDLDKSQLNFDFEPTYHKLGIGAYPLWPVLINDMDTIKVVKYNWGPIPKMLNTIEKVKKQRQMFLNSRTEKYLTPGTMWNAILHQRCIIPVTGFFEYREIGPNKKICYYIRRRDGKPILLAGLWALSNSWDVDKPEKIPTFTMGTREANSLLRYIHNSGDNRHRMPMILKPGAELNWLNSELDNHGINDMLSYEVPSSDLIATTVRSVRKVHPDDETVIEPFEYPGINVDCEESEYALS
ncbi:SOS response-associated peptidase [Chitinophaga polysaccharea]|uniref:SOS response-associated peptidase n=1 Tax=Chitinophaga polysaccharea TaxID=1293035 RepID=UPI0014555CB5|nr:SOS response-associated peptidase family protein [Chitinophaga polysaccharea]NLR60723.1 SOS response-associated peptidase [Chitinophaga polysaccharea]